jgi:hypothetical protein
MRQSSYAFGSPVNIARSRFAVGRGFCVHDHKRQIRTQREDLKDKSGLEHDIPMAVGE